MAPNATLSRWALAWGGLTAAFALHVIDEATHDFLAWYNPSALRLQERLGGLTFPPVFSFPVWLAGLTIAIVLLAMLTRFVSPERRWAVPAAYAYAIVHVANTVGHMTISIAGRWLAPGVLSSPILLAMALWLLYETAHAQKAMAGARSAAPASRIRSVR